MVEKGLSWCGVYLGACPWLRFELLNRLSAGSFEERKVVWCAQLVFCRRPGMFKLGWFESSFVWGRRWEPLINLQSPAFQEVIYASKE